MDFCDQHPASFTVCLDEDDVLGLVKVVAVSFFLEDADHHIDTMQRCIDVGACFMPVA